MSRGRRVFAIGLEFDPTNLRECAPDPDRAARVDGGCDLRAKCIEALAPCGVVGTACLVNDDSRSGRKRSDAAQDGGAVVAVYAADRHAHIIAFVLEHTCKQCRKGSLRAGALAANDTRTERANLDCRSLRAASNEQQDSA